MTRRSVLPAFSGFDPPIIAYLQKLEAKLNAIADLENLDPAASLPTAVAKLNEVLEAARR